MRTRAGSSDADRIDPIEVVLLVIAVVAIAAALALAVRWVSSRSSDGEVVASVTSVGNADVPSPSRGVAMLAPVALDLVAHGHGGPAGQPVVAPGWTAARDGQYRVTIVPPKAAAKGLSWDLTVGQGNGVATTSQHVDSSAAPAPIFLGLHRGDTLTLGARSSATGATGTSSDLGSMHIARTGNLSTPPVA